MNKTIVAEGTWCTNCEFFEVGDWDGDRCMACGCDRSEHNDAEVVGAQ